MKSNKTKSAMTALVIAAMLCSAAMPIRAAEAQWVNNNGTWSYVKEDGSIAKGWIKDGDCWYAFDDNGAMRTGWIASNEHWYFMGESGVMQADAWVEDNGARYYIKGTGVMAKDYVKDGYELTEDGKAIPLAESKSVVLTDPEALEGEVIEGNLYVDVTTAKALELKGVTVKGKLVIIGDNKTAGKLTITDSKIEAISTQTRNTEVVLSGETEVKTIVLEETAAITPDKSFKGEVEKIEVQSTTKGEIVIEVPAQEVSTRTYASVDIQAPVESLEVKTDTQIKVNADVKNVVVTESAKDTAIEVSKGSTVGTLTADAPVSIDGKGTINKVEANVDGVEAGKDTVIKDVETGKDVEKAPEVNKPSTGGSTGGSGGGGGSTTPTKSETEKFKEAFDKELNGDFKANAEKNGVTFTVENDPVHDCIVINGTVKDTSKNLWNFTKETILDSIVRVDLAYTNIQSVRISFNGNTTGDILMTDLRTISPENLEKWGKDLFKKDSKEELLKLTLADIVDSSSFAVQFTIANKEVVNYVIPLHEENLEKEAIKNLKRKVKEAVGNVKTNDLATITMPDSVEIHTEFLSGDTTISQITGTGIFSILTTLTNEGVTGYTFDDSSKTTITGTPTYDELLTILANYLNVNKDNALSQTVNALDNKNIVVTVAYKDANGAEVNVEYTFTFSVSENIED